MLSIISSPLVVEVQSEICHLLLISIEVKGRPSLANGNSKAMAIAGVGAAAVALLVEVAKGLAQPLKQGSACVPA